MTYPSLWLLALAPLALALLGCLPTAMAESHRDRVLNAAQALSLAAVFSAALACLLVMAFGSLRTPTLGAPGFGFAVYLDALSAVMYLLVAFIGAIVIHYSQRYLAGDPGHGRFVARLSFTLAAVLLLILAGNLLHFAIAWIATSAGVHRLLVFYPERPAAILAARKKFIASRLGDACLLTSMWLLWWVYGSFDYSALFAGSPMANTPAAMHGVALLLVITALLKSAQFPMHGWLLEVMETPTPVSALLHAGIINAGGYLVLRFADVISLSSPALDTLAIVGGFTALFASLVMLTQTSIKVSLAWSTIAQMGFMLLQCGLGAFSAALLHILAHSCYKAHAFLSSGSVIDIELAAWTPGPGGQPHPARLAVAILIVVGLALAIGAMFGATPITQPGVLTLGTVLMLGLVHLVANGIDAKADLRVVTRALAIALTVAVGWFGLQFAASKLFAGALPPNLPADGSFDVVIAGVMIVSFIALTAFQAYLPHQIGSPVWRRFHVHVWNGFYVNTLINRAVVRLWPSPAGTRAASRRVRAWRETLTSTATIDTVAAHAANSNRSALLKQAMATACERIAPVWPLASFVAVNPFLGFSTMSFEATCANLRRVAAVDMLMPRAFYRECYAQARLGDAALASGLAYARSVAADLPWPADVAAMRAALARNPQPALRPPVGVATVAEVLDGLADGDRQVSRTAFMIDEISRFCAVYFDNAQSVWRLPGRDRPIYRTWRDAMRLDRNAQMMGIAGFRQSVADMPDDPVAAIAAVVDALGIPDRALVDYLHRALFDIGGWAAYVRHLVWNAGLDGRSDDRLEQLLAIRLVWGYALFRARREPAFLQAWQAAMVEAAHPPRDEQLGDERELALDLVLQYAYESVVQRKLSTALRDRSRNQLEVSARSTVQAAFCIDVRSEVYRRALEAVAPDIETIGFAGFFGFPIEYVSIGNTTGTAQCPVLLKPSVVIIERVSDATAAQEAAVLDRRRLRRRVSKAWKSFKAAAISSFTFVETMGLLYSVKIASDSLGLTRPVADPATEGLDPDVAARTGPCVDARELDGRATGFEDTTRVAIAASVLRAMSMTNNFARLVALIGHGATTVNNPHAAGLDCGACGGHSGQVNARVAAAILNDPAVRSGLHVHGIVVPDDTWFIAGLHDTTTDVVSLADQRLVPSTHRADLAGFCAQLAFASVRSRAERSPALGIDARQLTPAMLDAAVMMRSRDWSQVRPEWGLAGNASFIAAPRSLTAGLDLEGRAFLHSYDWRQDTDFAVLTLIMTAPMVVASWINLQYYGSTVNNEVFGAGNKVLHNVTGALGVLEGNVGDLRVGLPWQSVHDGERFMHEPVRLSVVIAAPTDAIDRVIAANIGVAQLVANRWIHLMAIDVEQARLVRWSARGIWQGLPLSGQHE